MAQRLPVCLFPYLAVLRLAILITEGNGHLETPIRSNIAMNIILYRGISNALMQGCPTFRLWRAALISSLTWWTSMQYRLHLALPFISSVQVIVDISNLICGLNIASPSLYG